MHTQGFIDGKWVDAKDGGVIKVTSAYPASCLMLLTLSTPRRARRPCHGGGAGDDPGDGS